MGNANGTKEKKATGVVIDVDAHSAARRAKLGDPPSVHVGGRDFVLPLELPAEVIYAFGAVAQGDLTQIERGMKSLFGDHYATILELVPAWPDHEFLVEETVKAYGITVPEFKASGASS